MSAHDPKRTFNSCSALRFGAARHAERSLPGSWLRLKGRPRSPSKPHRGIDAKDQQPRDESPSPLVAHSSH